MSAMRGGALFVFVCSLSVVLGCGGAADTGEVSGSVKFDGKPVEEGSISFIAVEGSAPTAGGVIKDGKYTATKVPVGAAKVSISAVKVVGKRKAMDAPGSKEVDITEPLLPAKYNTATELRFDVKPGTQTKDFDLTK